MIIGAHSILYSTDPGADRAFLRDVLLLPSIDQGGGWLIFGLPPSEVAVHPSETGDVQELYLMCDDVGVFVGEMHEHGVACSPVQNLRWGLLTYVTLPGGGKLGVYEPRHARPEPTSGSKRSGKARIQTGKGRAKNPRAASPAKAKAKSKKKTTRARSRSK